MKHFVHVSSDDWEGIYVDEILQAEGHRISLCEGMAMAHRCQPFTWAFRFLDDEWMENAGSLPRDINRIPREAFLS